MADRNLTVPIRIVIADDHALFRELLLQTLPRIKLDYSIVGVAEDGKQARALVARKLPDILLLDYKMAGLGRLGDFSLFAEQKSPHTKIILLTGFAEEGIALEAVAAKINGYVLKGATIAELLEAISAVYSGKIWIDPHLPHLVSRAFSSRRGKATAKLQKLTRQELRIVSLLAQGKNNHDIAAGLFISTKTVKNHVTHILAKLKFKDRKQAADLFDQAHIKTRD